MPLPGTRNLKSIYPQFLKDDALAIFDAWNDVTGAIAQGTSWYGECVSVIEQITAMAFGAGIMYEAKRDREGA
jgi:hypothetical protein